MISDTERAFINELSQRVVMVEEALENQEHTIREQEKDIVTLKLQVEGLYDRQRAYTQVLEKAISGLTPAVATVATPVSTCGK